MSADLCVPCSRGEHDACDNGRGIPDPRCACVCPSDRPFVRRPPALLFGEPVAPELLAAFGAVLATCERTGETLRQWLQRAEQAAREDEQARQRD